MNAGDMRGHVTWTLIIDDIAKKHGRIATTRAPNIAALFYLNCDAPGCQLPKKNFLVVHGSYIS